MSGRVPKRRSTYISPIEMMVDRHLPAFTVTVGAFVALLLGSAGYTLAVLS